MLFISNDKIQQSQRFLTFFAAVDIKVHRISIYVLCCSCPWDKRVWRGPGGDLAPSQQHRAVPCLKIGCACALLESLDGPPPPMGAQLVLPKPNLTEAYLGSMVQLLE
jgi:hypothetical protein